MFKIKTQLRHGIKTKKTIKVLDSETKTLIVEFDTDLKNIHPCRVSPGFIIRHAMETFKLSSLIYTLVLLIQVQTFNTKIKL